MKKYVIFDLEATCDEGVDNFVNEIIEIGAVMIDKDGEVLDKFEAFAKPYEGVILTDFCKTLTTIKQCDIDNATSLNEVLISFYKWSKDCTLVSWGGYDMRQIIRDSRTQMIEDIIDTNDMKERHINFKRVYAKTRGLKREVGISGALKKEGMVFVGTKHRGIDDAMNIKKIFVKLL